MDNDNLLKSLQTIAFGHSEGFVSVDKLRMACEAYKRKTNFDDGYRYQLIISKSIHDQLNGIEQDEELCKAIIPGDTKVIDGILYVWSKTKAGSQTQYAWHVANKGSVTGMNIGKGSTLTAQKIADLEKQVNELFPADLKSLKAVGAAGGSTGAQLVDDAKGNRYILKKGTNHNTNNEHVINEYLANQLYSIAGVKVPSYQLYDDNGTACLLSKFIYGARNFNSKDFSKLKDYFLIDCLFANWDAYANTDNCLIDSKGNVIHVDNGGTLNFRAHGAQKTFDGNIYDTYSAMKVHNPKIANLLTDDDLRKQIADLRKKKGDLINYLKEVGENNLAKTIEQRIDNLSDIENEIDAKNKINNRKVLPRKLKSKQEMYREFTQQELDDLWNKLKGNDGIDKVTRTEVNPGPGWAALSEVCKMRGFDARGEVVDDAEYWKKVDEGIKHGQYIQVLRGLSPNDKRANKGKITIDEAIDSLLYQDACWYGTQAAWGAGIYAHINDDKSVQYQSEKSFKKTDAYDHAIQYAQEAGAGKGAIVKMILPEFARTITYKDAKKEILSLFAPDKKALEKCEKEIKAIDKDLIQITDDINSHSTKIEEKAYKDAHFDKDAWVAYSLMKDNVNWGKVNSFGDRDIPKFDDFVGKEMVNLVKANGGSIEQKKGVYTFRLPNSTEEFTITNYQYDGPSSIKRHNSVMPYFNFAAERFDDWFERAHVKQAEKMKEEAIKNSGDSLNKLMKARDDMRKIRDDKNKELEKLRDPANSVNANKGIYEAIYKAVTSHSKAAIGLYAALKGYDAIIVPNGNGSSNSFAVILNRSKLIINKNVERNV